MEVENCTTLERRVMQNCPRDFDYVKLCIHASAQSRLHSSFLSLALPNMTDLQHLVDDTFAEGFRSIYGEVLLTARDEKWLQHCIHAVTGHSSSTILCDCESGVAEYLGHDRTPDGRVGAVVQFHVPRFRKDRREHLEKVMMARISQNALTCPTIRCFNRLDTADFFKLGRKIALFGDGHQFRDSRFGQPGWVIPILGGEFFLSRRFGFQDGVMGGNLWFFGASEDAAIEAAEKAAAAVQQIPDTILPFPGGIAASGSKAGSRYDFMIASTYAEYCPTLKQKLGDASRVPDGVVSIQEIIINGRDLEALNVATAAAIRAAADTPGLIRISAGNYGGRLGKTFVHLHEVLGLRSKL
jgi:formylmethanofuran--tetrahydromethanopterin N-formyltransferase